MTGVERTREVAVFRWVYFSLILLGVASTIFGVTMIALFDNPRRDEIDAGVIFTGVGWLCAGCLGLIAIHIMQRGRFVRTMRVCCIIIFVLIGLWVVYSFLLIEYRYVYLLIPLFSSLTTFSVLTAMVVIVAYLLSLETGSQEIQNGARMVSWLMLICTVTSIVIILFEELSEFEILIIGLEIGWAATITGIIVISFAVRRENKPQGKLIRTIPRRVKMKMTCPQCQQWLEARSGPARCDDCGLRLIIEINEPRCVCGYLLYELQGNVCPECGRDTTIDN